MIAKEGKTNISGGANTHYTHVELRKGRHTSSSPYRDTVLTSDCPYAVMQQALGVMESGRQPVTAAAVQQAQRMREEAEAKAKAEAEAAQKAAEEEAKAQAEAEQNADITLVDALPGHDRRLWFWQCDGHAGSDSHPCAGSHAAADQPLSGPNDVI